MFCNHIGEGWSLTRRCCFSHTIISFTVNVWIIHFWNIFLLCWFFNIFILLWLLWPATGNAMKTAWTGRLAPVPSIYRVNWTQPGQHFRSYWYLVIMGQLPNSNRKSMVKFIFLSKLCRVMEFYVTFIQMEAIVNLIRCHAVISNCIHLFPRKIGTVQRWYLFTCTCLGENCRALMSSSLIIKTHRNLWL